MEDVDLLAIDSSMSLGLATVLFMSQGDGVAKAEITHEAGGYDDF